LWSEEAVLLSDPEFSADVGPFYYYLGIVLVALNPYQKLPIYEHNIIQAYAKKSIGVKISSFWRF